MRRAVRLSVVVSLALAASAPASAEEVRDAAHRVAGEWKKAGAEVSTLAPRFLYDDDSATVVLPEPKGACVSVAIVGARGMSFHAKIAGASEDPLVDEPGRSSSFAGVLELSRCGNAPKSFVVTSDAGRGALEIVVAWSKTPAPQLRAVLPERTGGATAPPQDPGLLPPLPPVERRADAAESRAKRTGGEVLTRSTQRAGVDGSGTAPVELDEGCHVVEVFAAEATSANGKRRARLDLDAELRDDEDSLLAKDRTESPDAHLEVCVGEPTDPEVV
ncbi:MAG: hypothetical protein JNL38_16635 [Myxococcales bacterium]|nr:hypothetical protein [Myxococcales bacterium]